MGYYDEIDLHIIYLYYNKFSTGNLLKTFDGLSWKLRTLSLLFLALQ
jgi:hypothetical protein